MPIRVDRDQTRRQRNGRARWYISTQLLGFEEFLVVEFGFYSFCEFDVTDFLLGFDDVAHFLLEVFGQHDETRLAGSLNGFLDEFHPR